LYRYTKGAFSVNTRKVKEFLAEKRAGLIEKVKLLLSDYPRKICEKVNAEFKNVNKLLAIKTTDPEGVAQQRELIESLPKLIAELNEELEAAHPYFDALDKMSRTLEDDDVKLKSDAQFWPNKLFITVQETEDALHADENRYKEEQVAEQEGFSMHVKDLENTITNLGLLTDMEQTETYARQMVEIEKDLKESQKQADLYNSRESLFGSELTDYTPLKKMMDSFDPFNQFWVYANNWKKWKKSWMTDPFMNLDAEGMDKDVGNAFKVMFKMGKQFTLRDMPTCASNCESVRAELEDFKKYLPLILALRSPGMRERHWTQISEEIGIVIPHDDPEYTLTKVLEDGLPDHMEAIVKVCDVAGKEYGIETAMEKMYGEWEGADLQVMEYRETGTFVIRVEETITQMLDDHIVMAQAMSFSPFKKPFEEQITEWERTLSMVSEVLDEWITVQRSWMYLEPIFGSDDIMQQLPLEGKRFAAVDRSWRKALTQANMTPAVLKVCNDRKLLEIFRDSNKMLEMVQKGLSDYLETKRLAFARFFFLSNDELLQILSQTKNPLAVQPHLRKCFEAINTLDFEDDLKIVAMNSVEKEKVPFAEHMYPEGNVENWLGEVERIMKKSCRHSIVESLKDYQEQDRPAWVKSWPAMTVLGVGCTYWTAFSEDAITNNSLPAWFDKNVDQLNDLTDMVRGKLTSQARETLGALITIDVHNRDTVTLLIDMGVKALSDFDWVCQLRYYWENDDMYCKMVQASLPFGYEYLGNQGRLVVTPLTDRCYMTLMGAMHLNLGGAPAGPAGTGKTETTKDLAKGLAMQCVVFNCSDGLDYLAMAKFFKGLASSGAWACFDEFNRIDLEVLSVVAAQILTIQNAIRQKLKRFHFEDSEIGLDVRCSVFITMNPGYAGRSELPDNLKALFRPCAMMVPDYALIGEISLMSFGFKRGRPLARKMVATFKLCSEQLSAQDHYDYGMRAVKSVITAAGNLKRDFPEEDEEVLLLRGIMDVNIPKFLAHDLPLFEGILSDLFPGVKKPDVDYGDLMSALHESCADLKIQPVPAFLDKVIQLYETTVVRHGLMLVGPTGGGKTMIYRSLAMAMTKLNIGHKELPPSDFYQKTKYLVLNPKSITMGQLYGDFDEATHEWTDGILACYMRDLAEQTTPDKKWLLFDGPVDAIWIENMNTVLDDNKKLCLVSGEIIAMSNTMTMMFEVEDLAVASPATVSRCGMVYIEPTSMGFEPLLDSYLQSLPELMQPFLAQFRETFMSITGGSGTSMDGLTFFIRKNLKETVTTVDTCLVMGLFNIMSALLKRYERPEGMEPLTPEEIEGAHQCAMPMWIFSLIWSVCASVTGPGRPKLDQFLRKKAEECGFAEHMPPVEKGDGSMYEYCFDQDELMWKEWMQTIPPYKPNTEQAFAEIIVPTADTVRYTYVMDKLLLSDKHVLCVGETGTGKTLNVMDKLSNHMPEQYVAVFMTFSARTSANQTQDFIDSKMDKRRKGVFGPPSGKKYAILIDDLNMPLREKYFAQPPIELLRQWQDHQGWYERKPPCAFRTIQDMIIVGCMGPPGGGRNPVSNRLLRHFNFLSFTDMSDESCIRIFDTILGSTLQKKFSPEVAGLSGPISSATIQIYNTVRQDLLPTPAKSHYTFNLRDLARVFQGLLRADPKLVGGDKNELFGLWMHENLRVFQDRMVNNEDREWFKALIDKTAKEKMGASWAEVVGDGRLIYGDYLIPGADPRVYQRVRDMAQLQRVVEEALEDYNSVTNAPMKLVMFLDAIEHVSRVCRVIRLPLGNALLLGVGGSGRQSLTRLAAALEEFELFQIEVAKGYGKNEWRDDLRKVLMMAGMEGQNVVFLFTDTQIVQENFLEDINNILNSGEVPNLWKTEDTEAIGAALRPIMTQMGLPVTKNAVNSFFVTRVRSNMHCVLAMSPVSEEFRQRLRMFPALVNCCTIDWFSEWPLEALESVANTFLSDVPLDNDDLVKSVVDSCVFIHQSVERKSKEFYEVLRRFNYVTPTSYLELLQTFIRLLGEKRDEIQTTQSRLQIGLDKLNSTASQVAIMEKELVDLQPVLAKTSVEVEEMIVVIKADTEAADETKAKVLVQEKEANEKAAEAKAIADDAQADLDYALPALDAALQSLKLLTRNDVVEVKALKNPPAGVKLVMEVACLFFNHKPKMVADTSEKAKPGAKVADYWDASTKMLNDPTAFLDSLMTYDKDNISEDIIKKAEPYMEREDFTVDTIAKVSKACKSICMWAHAMYTYYNVSVSVEPKRQKLAAAQASLEVTMGELKVAKATLQAVEAKLKDLNSKFSAAESKQLALKDQVAKCTAQLDRAGKLIGGLGGEKTRWEQTVKDLTEQLNNVVGDVVVSSGVVAYNGPFTPSFRADLLAEWSAKMIQLKVPHTKGADIVSTLADPVRIRAWNIAGLPTDSVSIENGIIVAKARRWPLMIDPQGQANKWVKNMEKDTGIDVIKLTEKDYLRTLANGIRFGRAVLLENIGENLDAALEPLLQKQIFKQGGSDVIKMGEDIIPYHPDFRFYMTTKMRNPHYQPEVSVKVSLLNFFVTLDGLEDQLLGTVVMQERSDLAELKNQLVVSNARMKKELKEIEDKILYLLSNSTGNILDDEVLINTLAQSKITSNEITAKVAEAEKTEKDIDETREKYRPVATRASVLFFCISDLALVDPMYQYSLAWFISLFIRGIVEAEKSEDIEKRIVILNEYFTYSLYNNICRSLFERHKLMFSLLLTIAILQQKGLIDAPEWRFLLAGPTDTNISEKNPAPEWITEKVWVEIVNLNNLAAFKGFSKSFTKHVDHYRKFFESADAHRYPLDPDFDGKLTEFQKLLVIRCIRPDRFMMGTQDFVGAKVGERFIEPPPFDLGSCYQESTITAPLIFVLSSGADPMADLLKFCDEAGMMKRFDQVSLGQGQGPKAEKLITLAMERGMWVCLQNCHLAQSWMPKLDNIVENIDPERVHRDFRLWLTSMPSPHFPVAILQNGVKMTLEPPKGLKSNLVRSYTRISDEYMDECANPAAHKKMLFSICLFHAVIQDRRKFGPLGWNITYDFTDGDLNMCQKQIKMMIDDYEEIPYKVIRVLCGEINYGGRVTDDKDRRLMNNLLLNYINPEVITDAFSFSPSGTYKSPKAQNVAEFFEFIKTMPMVPKPEIFGLHENADITCDQNETYSMFETVLSLQPRVNSGGGLSREDVIEASAKDIFERCPVPFDIDQVAHTYPTDYNQSMNTVLVQECIRYNALIIVMRKTLQEGLKALKGLVVMSPELEAVTNSIFDNQVPDSWDAKAFPSLKPLSSWVLDLLERIKFINAWIDKGPPPVYWISGFFFPQAFLTGTLQNYARKHQIAIDTVQWNFNVLDTKTFANTHEVGAVQVERSSLNSVAVQVELSLEAPGFNPCT
jgi:dynein heavy chain